MASTVLFDPAPAMELRQGARYHLARRSELGPKHRMGGVHDTVFVDQLQQARGQPDIHALKNDGVDQG